jgi:hypothetical protein
MGRAEQAASGVDLVGREHELGALDGLIAKREHVVVLEGGAGFGKTALVEGARGPGGGGGGRGGWFLYI